MSNRESSRGRVSRETSIQSERIRAKTVLSLQLGKKMMPLTDNEDVPAFHCPSPTFSNLDT
jgi:hypothetical protein